MFTIVSLYLSCRLRVLFCYCTPAREIDTLSLHDARPIWRMGRVKHKTEAQRPQVEMQLVFMLQQGGNLVLRSFGDQARFRINALQIGQDRKSTR